LAREVIRRINDWRKAAGLNIDDRIAVRYEASPQLDEAVEVHRKYIMEEILAVSFEPGAPTGRGFDARDSFAGQTLRVELEAVSTGLANSAG
jgi:isoleucyl-tRNA synthetase